MKKLLILALLLMPGMALLAQMKIGYTNAEVVLLMMPEYKGIDQQLRTLQQKYQENINIKQQYLQSKYQELQEFSQSAAATQPEVQKRQEELVKLQEEIEGYIGDAEGQMQKKRSELLEPLADKLKAAIDGIAKEKGYSYIINATLGGGSVLLYQPEEHDITIPLLGKLGVEVTPELEKRLKGEGGLPEATTPEGGTGGK
ncbi:MAG: OmpH family outer membrane protein [Sphingobacteriia bacterium]|jgi:outer membrane protein